jgi:hypothetical protein
MMRGMMDDEKRGDVQQRADAILGAINDSVCGGSPLVSDDGMRRLMDPSITADEKLAIVSESRFGVVAREFQALEEDLEQADRRPSIWRRLRSWLGMG